ncbi:MAG: ABC transporter permease [Gemmatimonadaceae bacterium]
MTTIPKSDTPPPLPLLLLGRLLPRAEREEVLSDVRAEYATMAKNLGVAQANSWLWQQAVGSAPSLMKWSSWRSISGFEPRANNYSPGGPMLKNVFADIRYAARRLLARPSYSLLAIVTLALGIGGTAAVYGVARPLMFDALPFANEKDVVTFSFSGSWTEQEFAYLRGKIPGYRLAGTYRPNDVTLREGDAPARMLPSISMSSELFDVLGARPMLGNNLKAGDDAVGADPVAILSYGLWRELGANPSIVGTRITLDGQPRTVVGVMPRGFWYPTPRVRVWLPQPINPEGQNGSYTLVARIAPGEDINNMTARSHQLEKILKERFTYSHDWDKTVNLQAQPVREYLLGDLRPAIAATFVAMGLILLIACTNVAALMLGQVEGRASELAVRAALGASRRRLTQPLIVEALLIGVVAGTVGALLAAAGFGTLVRALPLGAWSESASFDWTLFVAAMLFSMVAMLLVVLIPSSSLFRRDHANLQGVLSNARTGGVRGGGVRIERGLVIAEVALAMLIASGAALLVRSVTNLYAIDPGIDTRGVAVIDAVVSGDVKPEARDAAFNEILLTLSRFPGVQSTALAMRIPLRGNSNSFAITIEGAEQLERSTTFFRAVSADYFKTMGMKLKSGRLFIQDEKSDSGEVAVVINELLAQKYFSGQDPIGRRIGGGFHLPQRIIGVVNDVTEGALLDGKKPARYFLNSQFWFMSGVSFVVKTNRPRDAEALLDPARASINRIAPSFAVQRTTTMERVFDGAVGPARQIMLLLTILSGLALLLGAVGIYGVISHFATRRKRDWAIRVALGLTSQRVVTNIVGQGATLIIAGVVVGAALTMLFSKMLASLLFGVTGLDPLAFLGASAAVLTAGLIAAFVPARRAGTVDPAIVLREQ